MKLVVNIYILVLVGQHLDEYLFLNCVLHQKLFIFFIRFMIRVLNAVDKCFGYYYYFSVQLQPLHSSVVCYFSMAGTEFGLSMSDVSYPTANPAPMSL